MLKGTNDQQLLEKKIHNVAISFYQIWQELVNEKTLDVYQYRVLNTLNALKELSDVIKKTINGLFNSDANIEACREEILHILNRDKIMECHYKALLNRIRFAVGNKPKTDADKNLLLRKVEYAIREIEPQYLRYALKDLKKDIQNRMSHPHQLFFQ